MKQFRTAGILLVLLLVLGGIATWDEWQTEKDQELEKNKNKLAPFVVEDVVELEYVVTPREDDSTEPLTLKAVKEDGTWRLREPVNVLADESTIENLLKTIADYSYKKKVADDKAEWATYGVDEPQRTIVIKTGGDKTTTVYVGNKAPVDYSLYMRTDGDDSVYLGSQHLLTSTTRSLHEFRDKSLVDIDEGTLKRLIYERKGSPAIEVLREGEGYQVTRPESFAADMAVVRDFVDELSNVKVAEFMDQPSEDLKEAFAAPGYKVTWETESGESRILLFTEKGGKVLAAFDPAQRVFAMPNDFNPKIRKDLKDFRNRRILNMDSARLSRVQIDGDVYKNVKGEWYREADAGKFNDEGVFQGDDKDKPKEQVHVRSFVVDMEFAKTEDFLPLDGPVAKDLPDAPLHRIQLHFEAEGKQEQVTLDLFEDKERSSRYLVRKSGGEFLYSVPKSDFSSMTPSSTSDLDLEGGDELMENGDS